MPKQGFITVMLVAGSLVLAACAKEDGATVASPGASGELAATAASAKNVGRDLRTEDTEALGIAECDEFLTEYAACVNEKVPAASRDAARQSIVVVVGNATRAGWKQAVAVGSGDQLAADCMQMKDTSKVPLQAYGCSFW